MADDISGILGFLYGIYRRCIPLQMTVTDVDIVYNYGEIYLVLFHQTFENRSSSGRTVYDIQVDKPESVMYVKVHHQRVEGRNIVRYQLPNYHDWTVPIPFDEILQLLLYIPPNQSMNRWMALLLSSDKSVGESYEIGFVVLGTKSHHLATCHVSVRTSVGLYRNIYS